MIFSFQKRKKRFKIPIPFSIYNKFFPRITVEYKSIREVLNVLTPFNLFEPLQDKSNWKQDNNSELTYNILKCQTWTMYFFPNYGLHSLEKNTLSV